MLRKRNPKRNRQKDCLGERWPLDLLDLSVYPKRPSYTMAREEPLLLYRCEHSDYDGASTPTDGEEGEGHGRGEGGEEKTRHGWWPGRA